MAQSSTYILLLSVGFERGGTAPIFLDVPVGTKAVDPVVGALTLTDIVVGATVSALLLALAVQAYKHNGSLDPERLGKGPGLSVDALPALPVALPLLVAAVLVGLAPVCPRRVADTAALATAAVVTVCCLALLADSLDGPVVYWFGGWTPRDGIALGVAFAVDPVGAAVASLAGVLATAALTFSWRIFEAVRTLHHGLMLVFLAGIVGFCLSGDLFNMFVFYELFSVAAYALAGYRTTDPGSVRGALNFAITNSVGAILVLAGIALLYGRTGALNLAQLGQSLAGRPADRLVVVAFLLLMVGFFVKAAVVPFHFWLADAYALAPTVVGVLFAGVVSELGLYAVVRVYWTVFSDPLAGIEGLRGVMLLGAVTTALVGGVMCLLQHHLSRMLAYATVSHVGLTLAGFALLGPAGTGGAVLYLVADGMLKGSLFISVGILDHHLGDVDELRLQGRGRHLAVAGGADGGGRARAGRGAAVRDLPRQGADGGGGLRDRRALADRAVRGRGRAHLRRPAAGDRAGVPRARAGRGPAGQPGAPGRGGRPPPARARHPGRPGRPAAGRRPGPRAGPAAGRRGRGRRRPLHRPARLCRRRAPGSRRGTLGRVPPAGPPRRPGPVGGPLGAARPRAGAGRPPARAAARPPPRRRHPRLEPGRGRAPRPARRHHR